MKNTTFKENKNLKKLIFVFLITSTLYSCKKYEGDNGLQLNTAKNRISREWVINNYLENGKDQTAWFKTVQPNFTLSLTKDGNFTTHAEGAYSIGNYSVPIEINEKGKWDFAMNKKNILLNYTTGAKIPYAILKLSKTELWCQDINTPEKEYHYKAK